MKTGFFAAVAMILLLAAGGCQKEPINGDLDGQWQVIDVTPQAPETIINERLYYCFSLHTVQLSYYGPGPWTSGNILKYGDNTLVLEFPYADAYISIDKLKQYGIYSNPVSFTIEHLDKNRMTLRDGDVVISLRKF